ncbi:YebG family protein [Alteromonas flava]|uniref:YebG family protein n=1 Tax=Alteromonas flava TaxID=2048003 RepID=UPI000C28E93A|nr:YebG family protein [Alteromonas flava]
MAITIQYVVSYKGVEKLVTTDKKAADQYDKMLDIADNLQTYLSAKMPALEEQTIEELAFTLAQEKVSITKLLKGTDAAQVLDKDSAQVLPMDKAANA